MPKRRPPRFTALAGVPVLLAEEGGCGTRSRHISMTRAQTVLADGPFLGCDCSAVLRGTAKPNTVSRLSPGASPRSQCDLILDTAAGEAEAFTKIDSDLIFPIVCEPNDVKNINKKIEATG